MKYKKTTNVMERRTLLEQPRRYEVTSANGQLPIFQKSVRAQRGTENEQAMKLFELCKSNPSITINPVNTKHAFGRQSLNAKYAEFGQRQAMDTHIQMTLRMPKSYVKSLQQELKRPHAHIYEANNKLPDPIKLYPPPGARRYLDGGNTTGRVTQNQRSRESVFDQAANKAYAPTVHDSVLEAEAGQKLDDQSK